MTCADPLLPLAVALMLTFAGTGAPYVKPWLVKTVVTADGVVRVYRDGAGCTITLGGIYQQRVDVATCTA